GTCLGKQVGPRSAFDGKSESLSSRNFQYDHSVVKYGPPSLRLARQLGGRSGSVPTPPAPFLPAIPETSVMRFTSFVSSGIITAALFLASAPTATAQEDALPVCNNGGPYTFECTGPQTFVQLDGTASSDPDGTPVTFLWF